MALAKFSVIVAIDKNNGFAKDGTIPWVNRSDMAFFRETTLGRGKNIVIMGRTTYESIPLEHRPLKGRHCLVVSSTWKQEQHPEVTVCSSLTDALATVGAAMRNYEEVFIAGGERLYREAVTDFNYLCRKIYVTKLKSEYDCDLFFPFDKVKDYPLFQDPAKMRDFNRYVFAPNITHGEYQYLELLTHVKDHGDPKPDRTGVGTRSIFGAQIKFDISERIPVITTRKINYEGAIKELLFFVSGKTDTTILTDQNVNIWKENTSREFLDGRGLGSYAVGDMGPGYPFQLRHWGAEYKGAHKDYSEQGIDQLQKVIQGIRDEPHSRRHVISYWNVGQLDEMALPPCHVLIQFYVSSDRKYLDCQVYQRSMDLFLGGPWNFAFYSMLTYMVAHVTGLLPRNYIHVIGDAHIYSNHIDQVSKQVNRTPRPFPRLTFNNSTHLQEIDDFDFSNFDVHNYSSWPVITAQMAV